MTLKFTAHKNILDYGRFGILSDSSSFVGILIAV